jgi:hypothetical protein
MKISLNLTVNGQTGFVTLPRRDREVSAPEKFSPLRLRSACGHRISAKHAMKFDCCAAS